MEECAPTVRGEIKKARVGNYDFVSGIFEFIDNAMDAGSKKILINIRNRGETGHPHKVLISDNNIKGIEYEYLTKIFSWTFERNRGKNEIGEYGTGFKTAAVNLGERLTVLTKDGKTGRCFQAVADWHDMSESNRWGPRVQEIDEEVYGDTHPFSNGTTFIIEGLRYELIPLSGNTEVTTSMQLVSNLYEQIVYAYRYLLKNSDIDVVVKGSFPNTKEAVEKRAIDHDFFHRDNVVEKNKTSKIRVYHDQSQFYRVFFQRENSQKWEMIQTLEKRKNGSNHLKSVEFKESMFSPLRLVEEIRFCTKQQDPDLFQNNTSCLMDILYAGRVVGQNINLRGTVPECPIFIKHELWYTSYALNGLLSVQYNKKNSGMSENDLTYTLEYLHHIHEKDFKKEVVEPATEKKQARKNFSSQTKIQILTRQECRDSIMDFVLKETILPMDYDHKNGENNINSAENCQALSVITHAIKTRYPDIYGKIEANRDDKISYIVDLLNCITRSKHFSRSFASGKIRIDRTNIINEGLFRVKN